MRKVRLMMPTSSLRQFIDRQSFDPESMEQLNATLEVFTALHVNTVPSLNC